MLRRYAKNMCTQNTDIRIIAALISAVVSLSILLLSRFVFSRSDRRFPILVSIQEELLKLQSNPPWDVSGGGLHLHEISDHVAHINPYFARLKMVSFPRRNCSAQKAWQKLSEFDEDNWKEQTTREKNYGDSMTQKEFNNEIEKILNVLF